MGKRRFRGHDPAAKARQEYETRRDPSRWGTNEEALRLAQNGDVHSVPETRTTTRRVQRFDCFATLKLDPPKVTPARLNAIRRFQDDLAERYHVGDRPGLVAVDASVPDAELKEFRSIEAAKRIDALEARMVRADFVLLMALSVPPVVHAEQANWHKIVRQHRGLIDRDAQASCVKTLSESVRLAYAEIDGGMRRAA